MKTESAHASAKTAADAVKTLQTACPSRPAFAVVLGSGVDVLNDLRDPISLTYKEVFGIGPGVAGHSGSITVGRVTESSPLVAVFRGRFHLYEGHDWNVVTLAAKVIAEWGVPSLLLTNAAGGLNKNFAVGDLMVLTGYRDHLHPKWKDSGLLPALLEPAQNCRNALVDKVLAAGKKLQETDKSFVPLQSGVYAGLLGPCYETMAEIEMLRRLKADAVGMSTVPELQTVAGTTTEAAAISVITNVWQEDVPIGGHEEVLEASRAASLRLDKVFKAILA
ncbi:MAG TPA: purine-nucleoside phosphorylase [Chroococcales cyanobacterium]